MSTREIFSSLEELIDPAHTALVVVDMQNDFCHPDGFFAGIGDVSHMPEVTDRIAALVDGARAAGVLVLWVQQVEMEEALTDSAAWIYRQRALRGPDQAARWCVAGTWGCEFVAPLRPCQGEPIVPKHRSSGFIATSLDLLLRSNEICTVLVVGVATEGCVEGTARDAIFHDYYVVLVSDCVMTYNADVQAASLFVQSRKYDALGSEALLQQWAVRTRA